MSQIKLPPFQQFKVDPSGMLDGVFVVTVWPTDANSRHFGMPKLGEQQALFIAEAIREKMYKERM